MEKREGAKKPTQVMAACCMSAVQPAGGHLFGWQSKDNTPVAHREYPAGASVEFTRREAWSRGRKLGC